MPSILTPSADVASIFPSVHPDGGHGPGFPKRTEKVAVACFYPTKPRLQVIDVEGLPVVAAAQEPQHGDVGRILHAPYARVTEADHADSRVPASHPPPVTVGKVVGAVRQRVSRTDKPGHRLDMVAIED